MANPPKQFRLYVASIPQKRLADLETCCSRYFAPPLPQSLPFTRRFLQTSGRPFPKKRC